MNRIVLIGDIHTEAELLATVIRWAEDAGVDRIISVGDVVDGPGDPLACIDLLRTHSVDVVRGNHERWVVEGRPFESFDYTPLALAWMHALPRTREYDTPAGRLLVGHGSGDDDMNGLEEHHEGYALQCLDALWKVVRDGDYRWLVGGHTHRPMVRTIENLTVINPGTLVLTQEPGFMFVDFERAHVERWELLPALRRTRTWSIED